MGAIGVVRVAGWNAWSLVAPLLRCTTRTVEPLTGAPAPGRIVYARFVDGDEVIDDCLITAVRMGDGHAIDIAAHGGVRILQRILQTLARRGAVIQPASASTASAWPAASILEAEIVDALCQARTELAVRFLAHQRAHLRDHLLQLAELCVSDIKPAEKELAALINRSTTAQFLIEGATIVIVGPPNAGKSSLFNRLVGREAAVVSETPGTTRDWVAADLDWHGVPVHLIDTAGSRETTAALEAEAIVSGDAKRRDADIVLVVLDGTDRAGVASWCGRLIEEPMDRPLIIAVNKADCRNFAAFESLAPLIPDDTVRVSAKSGYGLTTLTEAALSSSGLQVSELLRPSLISARQRDLASSIHALMTRQPRQAAESIRKDLIGL